VVGEIHLFPLAMLQRGAISCRGVGDSFRYRLENGSSAIARCDDAEKTK
jgi:hypothetical protein